MRETPIVFSCSLLPLSALRAFEGVFLHVHWHDINCIAHPWKIDFYHTSIRSDTRQNLYFALPIRTDRTFVSRTVLDERERHFSSEI